MFTVLIDLRLTTKQIRTLMCRLLPMLIIVIAEDDVVEPIEELIRLTAIRRRTLRPITDRDYGVLVPEHLVCRECIYLTLHHGYVLTT